MMNLARNAQAYQQSGQMNPLLLQQQQLQLEQARQINPLLLQQQQLQLEQSKQLNPLTVRQQAAAAKLAEETLNPSIETAKAQSSSAITASQKAKREQAMSYANDAVQQLQTMVQKRDLNSDDIRSFITNQVKALNGPPEAITQALYGLPEKGTPTELRAFAAKKLATTLSAQAQLEKMYPSSTMTGSGGQIQPMQMGNELLTGMRPGTPTGPATTVTPTPSFQVINGVTYYADQSGNLQTPGSPTTMNAPQDGNAPQVQQITPRAQQMPQQMQQQPPQIQQKQPPQGGPTSGSLVKEDMPVAKGGLVQMNTQQQNRYAAGQKMFEDAATANQNAADQGIILQSIKQNLAQAQSSKPGQLLRQGGKFLAGNEQLDILLKDLAQNQLLQAKMMGGVDSVNAQNTVAIANGSGDIDPKALAKIVERTDATRLAAQMYNQGLSAYKSRDAYNSHIHADNFQQAWKSNYDPRIFMVENINSSNRTAKEKQDDIKRIIGISPPNEVQQLKQKAINIRRLQTGDF
jgi:hypothetical protein